MRARLFRMGQTFRRYCGAKRDNRAHTQDYPQQWGFRYCPAKCAQAAHGMAMLIVRSFDRGVNGDLAVVT